MIGVSYLFLGLAPSFIWLLIFLREDVHPESNRMILKIFGYGVLITVPAVLLEVGIQKISPQLPLAYPIILLINTFIGVALIEEVLKFIVVQDRVMKDSEFDEPTDAMLYMIIAALGFVALENILVLVQLEQLTQAMTLISVRFVGATFLHALCSGIVGFYLALSCLNPKRKRRLIATGLVIAIFFHGLFNLSITEPGLISNFFGSIIKVEQVQLFFPILILGVLSILVWGGFKKLRKIKSICKI